MSHLHEREEKICLNCDTQLVGRYCQNCGQENVEPKESTWHLIVHFFNDVTHFDGKFFTTMKPLFLKPGFLTSEYVKGRRASYLNPIRMYLFISAVFFLVLMSLVAGPEEIDETPKKPKAKQAVKVTSADTTIDLHKDTAATRTILDGFIDKEGPQTVAAYDSQQHTLPKAERDNFIKRYFYRRTLAAAQYGREHVDSVGRMVWSNICHAMPKVFFISLPLFAAMLMLLYIRRRKEFYYVSHAIFAVHIYCFSFMMWLIVMLINNIPFVGSLLAGLTPFIIFFYLYKAMRKFYKQGRGKTILKFIFMYFGISILVLVLAVGLAFNAYLNLASPH